MANSSEKNILSNLGDSYEYGFSDPDRSSFKSRKGLDEEVVRQISAIKQEPQWMLDFRLKAYRHFVERPMPGWGPD
ncbi:MAG: Fe-S cluster assembly protein SufB, partial [Chloroflexi bacterium]|nr:Fe-S cluster assembly protein SufB [Chloroflexota bacterium]